MDWFKKHVDTAITIGVLSSIMFWFHNSIDKRFNKIEIDLAVIKTVLIMKGIMPETIVSKTEAE